MPFAHQNNQTSYINTPNTKILRAALRQSRDRAIHSRFLAGQQASQKSSATIPAAKSEAYLLYILNPFIYIH
jgi:hypothetical protein